MRPMQTFGLALAVSIGVVSAASAASAQAAPKKGAATKSAAAADGSKVFATTCVVCHQLDGAGKEQLYPPLAGSEWVQGDENKLIRIILGGLTGPVEVAGETFNSAMPGWGPVLDDKDIAAVATYIRSSWGNKAAPITTAKVTSIRAAMASRKVPWTVAELAQVKD
ncbi:MAG: cytochrome c [Gemmatimonadaceae bacterium]